MRLARVRFTIRRAMVVVAVLALILSTFAAYPRNQDAVAAAFVMALVLIGPVCLAIEGNRRDAMHAERSGCPASQRRPGAPHAEQERTPPAEPAGRAGP